MKNSALSFCILVKNEKNNITDRSDEKRVS